MSRRDDWTQSRPAWVLVSVVLALALHGVPLGYSLVASRLGLPSLMELDLDTVNSYRERIIREMAARRAAQARAVFPLSIPSVSVRSVPDTMARRISRPHSEAEITRIRAVQHFIMHQWQLSAPDQPGTSLVSLSLLEDGSIGEFVVHRVRGNVQFQQYLLNFLNTLKSSYANQAGPGERMWIECEFAVSPGKDGRNS